MPKPLPAEDPSTLKPGVPQWMKANWSDTTADQTLSVIRARIDKVGFRDRTIKPEAIKALVAQTQLKLNKAVTYETVYEGMLVAAHFPVSGRQIYERLSKVVTSHSSPKSYEYARAAYCMLANSTTERLPVQLSAIFQHRSSGDRLLQEAVIRAFMTDGNKAQRAWSVEVSDRLCKGYVLGKNVYLPLRISVGLTYIAENGSAGEAELERKRLIGLLSDPTLSNSERLMLKEGIATANNVVKSYLK